MFYIQDRNGFYVNKSFQNYGEAKQYADLIQGEVITDWWCSFASDYCGCLTICLN